jgi:hypothetical protein
LIQTYCYAFEWQFVTTSDSNDKVYIDKEYLRINKDKINYFVTYVRQDGSFFVDLYSCNFKEKYSMLIYVTEYNKDGSIKGKKYMENSGKEYIVTGSAIDQCLKTAIEIISQRTNFAP